jgi:hypothetical protein
MWMHPAIAGQLAAAAIADVEGTGLPLQDRVAAAIMAAVEMEADSDGIIGMVPDSGRIRIRVDPRLRRDEWRLETRPVPIARGPGSRWPR